MSEPVLKDAFVRDFSKDFTIHKDVPGKSAVEEMSVVIDFLIKPKQHLIDRGFDNDWVGVEVKHLKSYKLSEINALAWQSLSYAQSRFNVDSMQVRPMFVLMHTNLSLNLQNSKSNGIPEDSSGVISFVERGNVGWIERDPKYTWRIGFGSHGYFNIKYGRAAIATLGIKRNAGNVKC